MKEHDYVSEGFSSSPRSDLKIGGNELVDKRQESREILPLKPMLNSGNTAHASKDIGKANEMSQVGNSAHAFNDIEQGNDEVGKVSESFVKGTHYKTELLGKEVNPCINDLNKNLNIGKRALVERNDVECVAQKRSGLDLNLDAVSGCLKDDLSSVCTSRRRDKPSSVDVYSECGSSNPVEEQDPMKLWETMKQNGFLSNLHGGISMASSSCLVSSTHGGIPAPRKRGRKSKNNNEAALVKKRKIEIARKEEVDRFARLAAPSGLLNELNPGIINHVRNKKQVFSIIENIVKSAKDSGDFCHSKMRHSHSAIGGLRKNLEYVNTDASRSDINQGFKYAMPEDKYPMCYKEECADDEFSEENNTLRSSFRVAGMFSENASSSSSQYPSNASVLTAKAATVASQWLELLHQDIRGRVSALRRSKKRVRAVVTTELPFLIMKEFSTDQENDPGLLLNGASRASTVDIHKTRWMNLFNQLEHTLSEEEKQLESWLCQVRDLQLQCDQGLQHLSSSSGQNFLQLGLPLDSRPGDAQISDKDLVVRAAAASLFSTCNFLMENVTCT